MTSFEIFIKTQYQGTICFELVFSSANETVFALSYFTFSLHLLTFCYAGC